MTQTQTPFIRVEEVSYTHWNKDEPTLKDLSLTIEQGTLNVLVGPGGSGKSTLCRVVVVVLIIILLKERGSLGRNLGPPV